MSFLNSLPRVFMMIINNKKKLKMSEACLGLGVASYGLARKVKNMKQSINQD